VKSGADWFFICCPVQLNDIIGTTMGFALSTFINPQKLKSGEKYRQEFYILRLFVIRALTYKVEGLIIYLDEKGINFHIVSGHIRSNDALIGSISF
jgi:hypothetical protein